jgi:fatty acid desaturase
MSTWEPLVLTDPVEDPGPHGGLIARTCGGLLRDERDVGIVRTALFLTAVVVVPGLALFIPGVFRWWLAPVYWFLYIRYVGPYTLMLHCVCHRVLFKREAGFMNHVIPWVIGPFFGHAPETYYVHHMGMHHAEGNLPADLSSTMKYQRDSFRDFLKYEGEFLFLVIPKLYRYMTAHGRRKLARRLIVGELSFLVVAAAATLWNPPAGLTVFVVPFMATRLLLMTGNWAQHAFVDPADPANDYRTVVTFVNSPYNRRSFNDGYHLTHHLQPSLHYLDMPGDFEQRREEMIRMDSLVFREIDYFQIFLMLMTKRYRKLASYYVELDAANPKTERDVIALIRRRLRRFAPEELAALEAGTRTG